jgi:hypothetical protein
MTRSDRLLMTGALGLSLLLGACDGVALSPSGAASPGPETPQPPADAPGASDGSVSIDDPGLSGGGVAGDPGSGVSGGGSGFDPGPVGPPADEEATLVSPVAGLMDVHDVGVVALSATVDGSRMTVRLSWWSGVAPCSVLSGVDVARTDSTFTLTVREGSAARDVACIDIAVYKATLVSLGSLDPGTYTVRASGDAAPIEVVVGS